MHQVRPRCIILHLFVSLPLEACCCSSRNLLLYSLCSFRTFLFSTFAKFYIIGSYHYCPHIVFFGLCVWEASYISFCLAHSGHRMSGPSVMNPLPTRELLHIAQMKQSLCQLRSSKEMKRVPPIPVIGLEQAVHLLANNSPKHSAQNGFSSRDVNRWPAKEALQLVHVKHSRCHGSLR